MIYEYQCSICGSRADAVRSISERSIGPVCCETTMEQKIFTAPGMNISQMDCHYKCVATGEEVTSLRQRKYLLDKHGLADARDFGTPDFEALEDQSRQVKASAAKPTQVPPELKDAMIRENMGDLL